MSLKKKLLFLCLLFIFSSANDKVKIITDSNIDELMTNSDRRLIIIFYVDNCEECDQPHNDVLNGLEWDESKAYIGKINCADFRQTCLKRFDIKYVPLVIIIENNTLYDSSFGDDFTKQNVLNAVTMPITSSGKKIPSPETFLKIIKRDAKLILEIIHDILETQLEGHIDWSNYNNTIALIGILSMTISIIFSLIVTKSCQYCCERRTFVRVSKNNPPIPIIIKRRYNKTLESFCLLK